MGQHTSCRLQARRGTRSNLPWVANNEPEATITTSLNNVQGPDNLGNDLTAGQSWPDKGRHYPDS